MLIEVCHKDGLSNREIARRLSCSPSNVSNELKRGTQPKIGTCGIAPGYKAQTGDKVCHENRERCLRHYRVSKCVAFVTWMVTRMFNEGLAIETCTGCGKRTRLLSDDEMICTKTVCNAVWGDRPAIKAVDLSEAVKCRFRLFIGQNFSFH